VINNIFEFMNKLPHFSDGNPTSALWGSVDFTILCSSFDDLGVLRVCGIGFGNPCGRDRHRAETSSRSAHNDGHNLNTMVDDGLIFNSTNTLAGSQLPRLSPLFSTAQLSSGDTAGCNTGANVYTSDFFSET
jgi:hypothetical protein